MNEFLHEIGAYFPQWLLGFIGGIMFIIMLSGIFTAFTNSEDDYDIDIRLEIFKRKMRKKIKKLFKRKKKVSKDQKPLKKMTKIEAKKEIKKIFDDNVNDNKK